MTRARLEDLAVYIILVAAVGQFFLILGGWWMAVTGNQSTVNQGLLLGDPRTARSLLVTLSLTAVCLVVQVAIALPLSIAIYLGRVRVQPFPMLTTALAAPATFGMAAYLLLSPGLSPLRQIHAPVIPTLGKLFVDPPWMFSAIVLVDSWQWIPPLTAALLLFALWPATSGVEALSTEGASTSQLVRYALLPQAYPVIAAFAAIRLFDLLRLHDVVVAMFGPGGPGYAVETFSMYLTKLYFQRGREIEAIILSFVYLGVIATVFSFLIRRRVISTTLPWNHESA